MFGCEGIYGWLYTASSQCKPLGPDGGRCSESKPGQVRGLLLRLMEFVPLGMKTARVRSTGWGSREAIDELRNEAELTSLPTDLVEVAAQPAATELQS